MIQKTKPTLLLSSAAALVLIVVACSAGGGAGDLVEDTEPTDETPASGGTTPDPSIASPSGGMGGAADDVTHPLLGAGNYTAADFSDPCDLAQYWELDVLLDLSTGALVLLDGTVYEVTGEGSDHGYTMAAIAPPCVEQWCIEQYAYEVVKSCPD